MKRQRKMLLASLRFTLMAFFAMLGFVAVAALAELALPLLIIGGVLMIVLILYRPSSKP
ncbi:MAG: hypothetical protein JJU29_19465 [Verrucomicrobia bacterium]|nr:hypothetical protein [Verrucomicrobiota bacterium]MCH8514096.1 hypothetical protein [Kiritimatiellia bacterium]